MDKNVILAYQQKLNEDRQKDREIFFKKLNEAYPDIWGKERYIDKLSVGPGWNKIIWMFTEKIHELNQSIQHLVPEKKVFFVDYIKEKFGQISIFLACEAQVPKDLYDEAQGLANDLEAESTKFCENCGFFGKRRYEFPETGASIGWIKTLCDKCWVEHAEHRASLGYFDNRNSGEAKKIRKWFHGRKKDYFKKARERLDKDWEE